MESGNKKNYKNYSSPGFTLIEVLAAVAVLTIGILGSLTVINSNLAKIYAGEKKIIAAGLVEDGMERVRNVRDTNWWKGKTDEVGPPDTRWDYTIDGTGDQEYARFFCSDNKIYEFDDKPSGGGTEEDLIDECALSADKDCAIYIYTSGTSKCYGNFHGATHNDENGINYSGVQYSDFYRLIHITQIDNQSNKVSVTVRWKEGGQNKYLTAEEILYNWK